MTVLYWVRELSGFYVVLTLSATGLAKFWSWRRTAGAVAAEGVIAVAVAPALVVAVSLTEVALAIGRCAHVSCLWGVQTCSRSANRTLVLQLHWNDDRLQGNASQRVCGGHRVCRSSNGGVCVGCLASRFESAFQRGWACSAMYSRHRRTFWPPQAARSKKSVRLLSLDHSLGSQVGLPARLW
jgi:hypothetical protein